MKAAPGHDLRIVNGRGLGAERIMQVTRFAFGDHAMLIR